MPSDATFRFGKATVSVEVEGCVFCGTHWSAGWMVARRLTVRIGGRVGEIRLHVCADCAGTSKPRIYSQNPR